MGPAKKRLGGPGVVVTAPDPVATDVAGPRAGEPLDEVRPFRMRWRHIRHLTPCKVVRRQKVRSPRIPYPRRWSQTLCTRSCCAAVPPGESGYGEGMVALGVAAGP